METNNGISIKGNVTATNIAVGDNATIISVNNVLDQLRDKVDQATVGETERKDIISALADLKAEINKQKLNKPTITSKWESVLKSLNYIKDLVPFATTIGEKIGSLIG